MHYLVNIKQQTDTVEYIDAKETITFLSSWWRQKRKPCIHQLSKNSTLKKF